MIVFLPGPCYCIARFSSCVKSAALPNQAILDFVCPGGVHSSQPYILFLCWMFNFGTVVQLAQRRVIYCLTTTSIVPPRGFTSSIPPVSDNCYADTYPPKSDTSPPFLPTHLRTYLPYSGKKAFEAFLLTLDLSTAFGVTVQGLRF
jgi:hypothetical protein